MDSDWSNPMMLITCYDAIGDQAKMRQSARTALDRAERALARDPTNGTALAVGAYSLAMFGEEERAREWIRRALLLDPDNLTMRYNLACTIVRQLGDIDETLETLKPFFERMNSSTLMRHAEVDPDLDPIRDHPRFKEMLSAAKERLRLETAAE
jgi:adenylate cyclase